MDPTRWRQIEELYHAALKQEPVRRDGFLAEACREDVDLRRQLELLLAHNGHTGALVDHAAWAGVESLAPGHTILQQGERLGPYEILGPLGKGGMGEVYTATDSRLGRKVAIKVSQERFSQRFEREARASAALNHPHICSLYDVGPNYLVMEYVSGDPLRGPLPLDKALLYASQICDALDAAHRKGVTHRDLKPGNIVVGENGVKVLDFGLAKIAPPADAPGATPLTGEGSVMGTLEYMAPEQIEGKEADSRSDIFALGVVLYELIGGTRPFTGTSRPTLMASILKDQPRPLHELQPLTSVGLERVIATCLEKDPDKRWQSAREVKHALEWMAQTAPDAARNAEAPAMRLRPWRGVAALLALIVVGFAGWTFRPQTEPPPRMITLQSPLPENTNLGDYVSLSPDGRKLVFAGTESRDFLWIRDLDTPEWRQLPGTEGGGSPFWSTDSRYLGFAVGNQLKKIDVAGGPPQTLCTVPTDAAGSGAWNRDGVIVFGSTRRGSGGPLWRISQAGGLATAITEVDASRGELYHALPSFLPDGEHFIYFRSGTPEVEGVYASSLDAKPGDQSPKRILAGSSAASYINGYLFFMRGSTLMAQPFDASRLQLHADPLPMAAHVTTTWYNTGVFSVSPAGVLAYQAGAGRGRSQLTWLDRYGKISSTLGQPGSETGISLSPDGTRAVFRERGSFSSILRGESPGDLWTIDLVRGLRTRLTFRQNAGWLGVWSPDGSRIAFAAGNLQDTLYEKASSGADQETELLKQPGRSLTPTSWSRDGRFLLYYISNAPRTGYDLWVLPLQGDRKPVLLLGTVFNEWGARFSPDMRWIAYASTETGGDVFVRPFTASGPSGAPALGEGKWQVSRDGGSWPRWRADGKEILFESRLPGRSKIAVAVKTDGGAFEPGDPRRLFEGPPDNGWDVTPDGKRILLGALQVPQNGQIPITLVLNWQGLLKK
ncbi:MAG: protein kinase [Candidatus Solibacter sp.]